MRFAWFAWFAVTSAVLAGSTVAEARSQPVTVFLERGGRVVSRETRIPPFGGGDRAWNRIVGCVREQYAPFQVEIVDRKPARGAFITAVVGGRASQLGLDDGWTNGVGPHTGRVIENAVVFVFSKVGTGERDVWNLCAVTAHEVAHALGLDHSFKCGDIMSYWLDRCGKRTFLDVDAPCGEDEARRCAGGARTQNSYRRLGALVGFRDNPPPAREPEPAIDPWDGDPEDSWDPPLEPADPYGDEDLPPDAYGDEDTDRYGDDGADVEREVEDLSWQRAANRAPRVERRGRCPHQR